MSFAVLIGVCAIGRRVCQHYKRFGRTGTAAGMFSGLRPDRGQLSLERRFEFIFRTLEAGQSGALEPPPAPAKVAKAR